MKNTKGVRQVLEDVYVMGRTDQNLGVEDFATLRPKIEAKLQEIMLGMLPEKRMQTKYMGKRHSLIQGWNNAIKDMEQNIREALKEKE